jgi:hypothetical protein
MFQEPQPEANLYRIAVWRAVMPSFIDLRENQTPIRNQSRRTCTTFCSIAALEAAYKRAGYDDINLSEGFFIYMI